MLGKGAGTAVSYTLTIEQTQFMSNQSGAEIRHLLSIHNSIWRRCLKTCNAAQFYFHDLTAHFMMARVFLNYGGTMCATSF